MADKATVTVNGIGLGSAVFIVFLVLKLLGKITWSWWWVTAPLWIPVLVFLGILGVILVVIGIGALLAYILK